MNKKGPWLLFILAALSLGLFLFVRETAKNRHAEAGNRRRLKLYWFVPDGLRADPKVFNIFEWAEKGELPNLRRMMHSGSYGYSIPVFPGHTPVNMATLFTGSTPMVHGVADGAMRFEGYPLKVVSRSGFSSTAKRQPPIWYTLEEQGMRSTLLSVPGSTPPELTEGVTIHGRWGGWGLEFASVIFQSDSDLKFVQGMEHRVFNFGPELTKFIKTSASSGWKFELPKSYSEPREAVLSNWGERLYAYIYDSTDDRKENYDHALFSRDKKTALADLKSGDWSSWLPAKLSWETKNDYNINSPKSMSWERSLSQLSVDTFMRLKVIRLGEKGFLRIRVLYDSMNEYLMQPADLFKPMHDSVGPVVDFVDNYPPQLVYFPEDKQTFLEEEGFSWDSHQSLSRYLLRNMFTEAVIHSTYTPNQMNTSRWWMPHLDPESPKYHAVGEEERAKLWREEKDMYKRMDDILGEILREADEDTVVVLSSDHGAVPLYKEVRLNNLFAKEGLLKYRIDPATGESQIDWANTKAIFLQMNSVYLNPSGLGGIYKRAGGPEYEKLRDRVIRLMQELKDDDGVHPLDHFVKWEQAKDWSLPGDRVGDIVVANRPGYNWVEEVSRDGRIFKDSVKGGYKQAVMPDSTPGMWTPFVIIGPGVRQNHKLSGPIRHIQQYPTIMKLLHKTIPGFVEGKAVEEVFQ